MSSVITGEAVVLELRPASFAARVISTGIDFIVYALLALGLFTLFAGTLAESLDPAAGRAVTLVLVVFALLIVPVAVETLSRGRSVGRLVMGLRIVRDDGGSIRFRHALIRGLLAILELYMLLGLLAFVAALFNDKSKRVGDMMAGTYSMRERQPGFRTALPPAPLPLQPWVRLADLGRLPEPLARRISRFLHQNAKMAPAARFQVAAGLATETARFVAPPPPAGTPPEDFLAAVMAERRDRDFRRLSRIQQRQKETAERLHQLPYSDSDHSPMR